MKKTLPIIALAALTGFSQAASTVPQVVTFSFVPNGNQTLTFDKFDTSLGNLTGVIVTTSFTKTGGSVSGDNDSASVATVDFTSETVGNISSSTVTLKNSFGNNINGATAQDLDVADTATIVLQPTSDDLITQFDNTGNSDFAAYSGLTGTATSSGSIGSAYFSEYSYAGALQTFTVKMNAQNLSGISAVSGVQYAVVAPTVSGNVTITYTYDLIPEPSAALLGGLGLLALLRRRR